MGALVLGSWIGQVVQTSAMGSPQALVGGGVTEAHIVDARLACQHHAVVHSAVFAPTRARRQIDEGIPMVVLAVLLFELEPCKRHFLNGRPPIGTVATPPVVTKFV